MSVRFKATHRVKGHRVALRGDRIQVHGTLRPAVSDQTATVQVRHGRRTVTARRVNVRPDGGFSLRLRLRATGTLAVRATHRASSQIRATRSNVARVTVFAPSLHFGSRGGLTRLFQRGLNRLKYPVHASGSYDAATGRAVMAYRKVNGLSRTEKPNAGIIRDVLRGRGGYKVRHPRAGRHVEADLSKQILALVDGDRLVRIYPTSSGTSATPTVRGSYRFYSKTPGTNAKGMVDSNYFIRGYAIHGYPSVPAYNASHGCLRIPIPNARTVYNWIHLGDRIIVEA